jgi:urease accessory protein UreF
MDRWIDWLLAARETAELRLEEANRGRALAELLIAWDLLPSNQPTPNSPSPKQARGNYPPLQKGGRGDFRVSNEATRLINCSAPEEIPLDPPLKKGEDANGGQERVETQEGREKAVRLWRPILARSQAAGFAFAAVAWGIPPRDAALGYAWGWLENLVLAAVKLVPLGQTQGQQALARLLAEVPPLVEQALPMDDDAIGAANPALAIASSAHETQYTRLFRS